MGSTFAVKEILNQHRLTHLTIKKKKAFFTFNEGAGRQYVMYITADLGFCHNPLSRIV